MTEGVRQADGASPVVEDQREVVEVKRAKKSVEAGGVGRWVIVGVGWGVGAAEAEMVGRDAPILRREGGQKPAVQVSARWIAVQQHDGGPLADIRITDSPSGGPVSFGVGREGHGGNPDEEGG